MLNRLRLQVVVALVGFLAIAFTLFYFTTSVTRINVPVRGGTYVEGVVPDGYRDGFAPPLVLNPILAPAGVSQDISALLFRGLTRTNAKGEVVPDIAYQWDYYDNNKVMEFHLRHDARWQDGEQVTARDVVFTATVLKDPMFGQINPSGQGIADVFRNIEVEALGDYTVRFTLPGAWTAFLNYTGFGLLPEHILGRTEVKDMVQASFNTRPIGNGDFRLLVPDTLANGIVQPAITAAGVALVATDSDSTSSAPNLDKIWFRFFPTSRAALTALQQGEIDGVGYVPPDEVASVGKLTVEQPTLTPFVSPSVIASAAASPTLSQTLAATAAPAQTAQVGINRIVTFTVPQDGYDTLFFNLRGGTNATFGTKEVRQAIAQAIDRPQLIGACLFGQAKPTYTPILPISWAYDSAIGSTMSNVAAANATLDKAGWQVQDGVRVNVSGQTLGFGLVTDSLASHPCIANAIATQLRRIGVVVTPRIVTAQELSKNVLPDRNYDALLAKPRGVFNDPDVYQVWHSSQADKGANYAGWKSDRADRLIEAARQDGNQDDRRKLYVQWQQLFMDEMPSVPLYYTTYTYALSSRIGGVEPGNLRFMNQPADRFKDIVQRYVLTRIQYGGN